LWLEEARLGIEATWHQLRPGLPFLTKLKAISRFYRNFCKKKALLFRAKEAAARHSFEAASLQLNLSPGDPQLQQQHGLMCQTLQNIESRKVEGQRLRSRIRWKFKGDMISTEFFKVVREKSTATAITGITDPSGAMVTNSSGINRLTSTFFRTLYASEGESPEHLEALESLLAMIPQRFQRSAQDQLDRLLSKDELFAAAQSMATNKSPGPDGFIIEFYTKF
jgi:hypothetical protein